MSLSKFYIFTMGCQMNKADSERLEAYLISAGLTSTEGPENAEVAILVTCGVRQSAENRIKELAPRWKKVNPNLKIVLTGCLALRPDVRDYLADSVDIWLPITELAKLKNLLGLEDNAPSGSLDYLSLEAKYSSMVSAYVPIGNGCNNFCAYCVVPYARGPEVYRPHQEIINEVKNLLQRGYKEITLIAQNVNSYKSDGLDFADLLKKIDELEGDFWLRFSTSHPKDLSEKLIATVARGKHTAQYFHLAVQAGDNDILRTMNRRYTAEHFLSLIKMIRDYSPEALISTDIIVGFPGESEQQFQNTITLMKKAKFDMAYIAKYSPRPGTVAEKITDDITLEEKQRREIIANDILKSTVVENAQRLVGRTLTVLADEVKKGKNTVSGKTRDFKTVLWTGEGEIGKFYEVEILEVKRFGLKGKIKKRLVGSRCTS